jgi:hypothetical protein
MVDPLPYYYECRYTELSALIKSHKKRKKITFKQNKILQFVASLGSISSSDLSKRFPFSNKPMESGNVRKDIRKLRTSGLLELDNKRDNGNEKNKARIKYKLSKDGVYNMISNNDGLPDDTAKGLLSNYNHHILFEFFLFAYIKQETLSKVEDSNIFSQILSYLHDCCKQLEKMIFNIDHTHNQKNGYMTRHIFVWENIPGEDLDRETLRRFLKSKFNLDWLDKARFGKTEDNNGIVISYANEQMLITIDKRRSKATLKSRARKEYELEFNVRELTNNQHSIEEISTTTLQEFYMRLFLMSYIANTPKFVASLIADYNPNWLFPVMEILGQDERFVQALRKTKEQFDKRCSMIIDKPTQLR